MFIPVPIERVADQTAEMRLFRLSLADTPFAGRYTTPGQYVKVQADGQESYFALASAPSADGWIELLVRHVPQGVAASLWSRQAGERVAVSAPGGKGFPLEQARRRDLVLVAAGSGVGPLRAVIQWVLARRSEFGRVTLFHGQRSAAEFAFAGEHADWERGGVRVVQVISRDPAGERRLAGYVQHAILEERPDVTHAVAFLAGMKEMIAPVTQALGELGLPRERVYMNF